MTWHEWLQGGTIVVGVFGILIWLVRRGERRTDEAAKKLSEITNAYLEDLRTQRTLEEKKHEVFVESLRNLHSVGNNHSDGLRAIVQEMGVVLRAVETLSEKSDRERKATGDFLRAAFERIEMLLNRDADGVSA